MEKVMKGFGDPEELLRLFACKDERFIMKGSEVFAPVVKRMLLRYYKAHDVTNALVRDVLKRALSTMLEEFGDNKYGDITGIEHTLAVQMTVAVLEMGIIPPEENERWAFCHYAITCFETHGVDGRTS